MTKEELILKRQQLYDQIEDLTYLSVHSRDVDIENTVRQLIDAYEEQGGDLILDNLDLYIELKNYENQLIDYTDFEHHTKTALDEEWNESNYDAIAELDDHLDEINEQIEELEHQSNTK